MKNCDKNGKKTGTRTKQKIAWLRRKENKENTITVGKVKKKTRSNTTTSTKKNKLKQKLNILSSITIESQNLVTVDGKKTQVNESFCTASPSCK